jgi:hypothetical protein
MDDINKDIANLEDIVVMANKIGMQYIDIKEKADYLELMKSTIKAKIMLRLDEKHPEISETKKRRMMEIDSEYLDLIDKLSKYKADSERLKIRYESYKNLFEAKRSMLSYKKMEMKIGL